MQDLAYMVVLVVTLAICVGGVELLVRGERTATPAHRPAPPVPSTGDTRTDAGEVRR